MHDYIFSVFPSENFVDLGLYQFGWEQCEPAHSFGPASRFHYLFHYDSRGCANILHSVNWNLSAFINPFRPFRQYRYMFSVIYTENCNLTFFIQFLDYVQLHQSVNISKQFL